MGEALKKLEYLSLVSKVSTELESHVGYSDKVLAEFITDMGRDCQTVDEFDAKLKENGAEFPDYFVRTLLTIIHAILPPKPKAEKVSKKETAGDGKEGGIMGVGEGIGTETETKIIEMAMKITGIGVGTGIEMMGKVVKMGKGGVMGGIEMLSELRGKEGLVHVSQIATRRLSSAKDVVKRDQEVYVKVISISGQKLSLSMRDVDQNTGKDLLPLKKSSDDDAFRTNPSGGKEGPVMRTGLSGIRITEDEGAVPSRRPLKRMSSPERWEAKQLIASGVMRVDEYPMYDEEGDGMLYQEEGAEEELEIELNEDEPAFLNGQTRYSVDMSPVKIFKNPEGSLSRAAALQSALIKERREVREQQQRTMLDSIPKDLNRPWEDPMPETGERHLAQELRGVGLSAYDMPEWKKESIGKALTFGQRSKLSIQEQRQSLPIYKLKKELIQAVHDNQVLVVIGETGSGSLQCLWPRE
ncbi:hypothetical protein COLO4_32032 [Corchorus olitorius]|uniref:S1 motif domain-containing protein n=1 Tax=Corchorus olitorius TaxID=93759 RepID=A0A1R3H2F9_9ROSI|nr:hypothetical protein COLO4_32032 [Corchorus olitorius]